ncbi:MAG: Ig-like domain-containing protein [Patescibacteria group bacterium]|jgi:hypothetical protein
MQKNIYHFLIIALALICLTPGQKVWAITPASASLSTCVLTSPSGTNQILANNDASGTITVTVRNSDGMPLVERRVSLSSNFAGLTISPSQVFTASNGTAVFSVRSSQPGQPYITAVVDSTVTLDARPDVAFIGPPSASVSTLVVDKTQGLINGDDSILVIVTAKDSAKNLLANKIVSLSFNADGYTAIALNSTTNEKGEATFRVKSTLPNTATIGAAISGVTITQTVQVSFALPQNTTVSASLSSAYLSSPVSGSMMANDDDIGTVAAIVRNSDGALLSGKSVTISASLPGVTFIAPPMSTTDSNGAVSFTFRSSQQGTAIFTVTADGVILGQQPTVQLLAPFDNVVSVSRSASYLSSPASSYQIVADNVHTGIVTVVARNAVGTVLSGKTASLSSSLNGITITPVSAVTDVNGIATFTIKSSNTGTPSFTTVIDGITLTEQPTVEFINPISNTQSYIDINGNPVLANNLDYSTVSVYAMDWEGKALSGRTVVLTGLSSGMISTPAQGTTDSLGRVDFRVTSPTPLTVTLGATIDGIIINQQKSLTFKVVTNGTGPVSSQYSKLWADYSSVSKNTAVTFRAYIADASNLPLSGKAVTLTIANEGTVGTYNLTTDAYGNVVKVWSPQKSGSLVATAVVSGITLPQASVQVMDTNLTDPYVAPNQSSATVSLNTVTVNRDELVLTVTARNLNGQALGGRVVQVTSPIAMTTTPSSALTNDSGMASYNIKFLGTGSAVLTIKVDGTTLAQKPVITVLNATQSGPTSCPFPAGKLIKLMDDSNPNTQEDTAVYYVGEDCMRHPFPNANAYFTWYQSFDSVVSVTSAEMSSLPLGKNVIYRPGARLIKFMTDPKVYAVSKGGVLKWITTEDLAKVLYGQGWNQMIDDIPDAFFTNYIFGPALYHNYDYSRLSEMDSAPTIDDAF